MACYDMLLYDVYWCCALCYVTWHYAMICGVMLYYVIVCQVTLCYVMVWYDIPGYGMMRDGVLYYDRVCYDT